MLSILFLAFTGCRSESESELPTPEPEIEEAYERGPVKVVVRIDKKEPTIAESIHLSLEVTADEAYEVDLPRFGEKLDQFGIVDYTTTPPRLIEGARTRQIRSYELEPLLSGDYTIPPMEFAFRKRDDKNAQDHVLATEEIRVKVRSLLPEDATNLTMHDIAGPVEMPRPNRTKLWWSLGGGLALVLAIGGLGFYYLRKQRPQLFRTPPVPPHEIAFRQLRELVDEKLPEQGQIKRFYQRVSDILRRYIENRFGLHAPEQTTDEFLESMKTHPELNEHHRQLLREFLRHCDLVKFAEHQPSDDEVQQTFDACRNFITTTRITDDSPHPPRSSPETIPA